MTANVARVLDWARYRFADHDALVFEDRRWTYWQFDEEVNALASALVSDGLMRGDRVAVIATNVPNYLFLVLALSKIGAVAVTLNYRLHEEELASQISRSGSVGLATEAAYSEVGANLVARIPALTWRASFDGELDGGFRSVTAMIDAHRGDRVVDVDLSPDDLQRIVYTSGTTGLPKGAMLTHGNTMANIHAQISELALTPRDRILNFAPLYHVGGLDIPGFATFYVGATMVLLRRFDVLSIMRIISEEAITGTCMVATMVHMIRDHPDRANYDMTSVRWMIFSQVSQTVYRATQDQFPNARLIEGYGLTETCNGVAYLDAAHVESKLGSVGRALHGVDLRVVDEAGTPVIPPARGEVVVRGAKVSPGYFDDPVSTAASFRDGWFHTGDVGYFDDEGYLFIVDRLKDMIRSGGENVASSEIESVLYEFAGIHEAAVVGLAHAKWLEVPAAFVVPGGDGSIEVAELIAYCGTRLGKFKIPKAVFIIGELPRNPTGKVMKEELRRRLTDMEPTWVADHEVGRSA